MQPRSAAPAQADPFAGPEWATYRDVAVFAEHETATEDGRRLRFGRNELQAVVNRCNERIRETGDYAAVSLGHTPTRDALKLGAKMPEAIGLAGPFKLGTIGQTKKRFAILADLHIFRDRVSDLKAYSRRSAELWLEDRYEDMILDPICLLGAEAPRLDLGMFYSRAESGKLIHRYAAAACAPGPSSVFVPSAGDDKKKYQADQTTTSEGPAMLGAQDVQAIVQAFDGLDWVQWVKSKMLEEAGNNSTTGNDEPVPTETPEPESAVPGAGPMMAAPGAGDMTGPGPAAGPAGVAPPPGPDAGQAPPPAAAPADNGGPPAADDDDDSIEAYQRWRASRKQRYMAGEQTPPQTAPVQPEDTAERNRPPMNYSRETEPERYARLEGEISRLEKIVEEERGGRINAQREQELRDLSNHFTFDVDDAIEKCRYGRMSGKQFQDQIEFIEKNCTRLPIGGFLPSFDAIPKRGANGAPPVVGETPGPADRQRYSKAVSDQAFRLCEDAKLAGKTVVYERVLEDLKNGRAVHFE